jgi:ureidoacrylate peracid hydrolase
MKLESVDLLHSAVIVIDIQNDFCHQNGGVAKAGKDVSFIQKMVPRVLSFLAQARQLGIPIIHVRTEHSQWTNSTSWLMRGAGIDVSEFLRPGSWGAEFYQVIPEPGEYIVTKHRYTAFIDTDLDLVLRSLGVKTIVLVGLATNVCVESTARDGYNKDYYVVLVEDCVASFSMAEHQAALSTIEEYFGAVTSWQNLVAAWHAGRKAGVK